MSELFAAVGLFAIMALWFAAPFIPAIVEWRDKRDAHPLRVVQDYEGEVTYFARRFRAYVENNMTSPDAADVWLDEDVPAEAGEPRRFEDGTRYAVMPEGGELVLTQEEREAKYSERVLLAYGSVSLPGRMAYLSEIYAKGGMHGDYSNIYRAILCDGDIHLGAESMVLRWLHATGDVRIGASSVLYGRLSADGDVALAPRSRFVRLKARRLLFGGLPAGEWAQARKRQIFELEETTQAELAARRWLVHRTLRIPAARRFRGDLVVYGSLTIGEDCVIEGSVKAHGNLEVGRGTHIEGSVIGVGDVRFQRDCSTRGPILSETSLWIAPGCRMGTDENPTTVSAPRIVVAAGVVAYGTVWAREHGELRE